MRTLIFPTPTFFVGDCICPRAIWKGGKPRPKKVPERNDYKGTKFEGESWPSHRLSYHLNVAPTPRFPGNKREGLVLHTCDNKWCINPEHLYLGSAKQNAQDNAKRNSAWRAKRAEVQSKIGFPPVSEAGRARMARANSERLKRLWRESPEEARRQRGI